MAPLQSSSRPTGATRQNTPRNRFPNRRPLNIDTDSPSEPPRKKLRYRPGGPGGGGTYVDLDGTEVVAGSRPGAPPQSGSARSARREKSANTVPPPVRDRPRRERTTTGPSYSSAAAAAAAVAHGDGYKPREERGWEEFHQDLDIDVALSVFPSDEVDGLVSAPNSPHRFLNGAQSPLTNGDLADGGQENGVDALGQSPLKRRPGRPPVRRPDSMLSGILTPDLPKIVPPPGPNPRERLTLPKPSYRIQDPYILYEQKGVGQKNYVDRTMASVGYQESDIFIRPERRLIRVTESALEEDFDLATSLTSGGESGVGNVSVGIVEYDMDEQDEKWLEAHNVWRTEHGVTEIKPAIFEITMTKIEKEWHALEKRIPKPNPKPPQTHRPRSSSAAAVNGEPPAPGEEQDSKCAVCDDGDCENANAIVFCDGCDLAVHQECYGVPYIPEGQWLCRKCQLIGRGIPTCIFCPNTEGAFKQTNSSRWAHLLCAIWIPEVSLGNPSLMEPVNDVEKVPKSRWKLACYICRQKMGACIQCSNKNCFTAFHVTCARRAGLYLKMKSGHGAPATMDSNLLKAFCDRHVPSEWRREHNTEQATEEAMDYYKVTMRGRRWADSQQSALALAPSQPIEPMEEDLLQAATTNAGGGKKRKQGPPKTIWRLLSGAPVIPQSILNNVEASLQRFGVNKKKEYATEACKYWTLKREARRGAALLKRLQLQMETFSSMEMTRRDFAAMGAVGSLRLDRRIEFAHQRNHEFDNFVEKLCDLTMEREHEKLKDAELLKDLLDTVYFPIPPLLWPILEKALM
jgi:NuA3 HAT complex component NTO1